MQMRGSGLVWSGPIRSLGGSSSHDQLGATTVCLSGRFSIASRWSPRFLHHENRSHSPARLKFISLCSPLSTASHRFFSSFLCTSSRPASFTFPSLRPFSSSSFFRFPPSSLSRCFATTTSVGPPLRKKVTTIDLQKFRDSNHPITAVTAYTYPSAVHVDAAGIDVIVVGDSVAMVELGFDTTLPVSVDEMLYHCKAVGRGAVRPLLVADLPFGSYEGSSAQAYANAIRFLKEADMDCVKLEGGEARAETAKALVDGGVAVMGHIGLTPQRISVLGGFRAQGKTMEAARQLIKDAKALEAAGCFAILIECVPAVVAEAITAAVKIPTIGIGAGPHVSGQVLVYHDLLGMLQHAHHAKVTPSFCKTYGRVGEEIQRALDAYRCDVESGRFPGNEYSPYQLPVDEVVKFRSVLLKELEADGIHIKTDLNELLEKRKAAAEKKTKEPVSGANPDKVIKVY